MIRRLGLFFLLTALAIASVIPQGWMPGQTADGRVQLVICTPQGEETLWVDLGDSAPGQDERQEHRQCPFGAVATAAELPAPVLLATLLPGRAARWTALPFSHASAGYYRRYDARGPPARS